jgi:tetratricopeptide (TPR) repeat protein
MPSAEPTAEMQRHYHRLMVALEASLGKLELLIAVCDDRTLQADLIKRYTHELQEQGIQHYRVFVQPQDPSLRYALEQLVQQTPDLQQQQPAVVTVLGISDLLSVRLSGQRSEQERLFGYLQWRRESFRELAFPIVIWMTAAVVARLSEQSPDFWSWRGGVFWFTDPEALHIQEAIILPAAPILEPKDGPDETEQEIQALLHQIEQAEQQPDAAQLASLYQQLGHAYDQRYSSPKDRQFAIQAFRRVVQLQTQLGLQAELANSLEKLGDLYFELQDDVKQAIECYEQALQLYRQMGDRQGEADALRSIGKVLQFLAHYQEALEQCQQALQLYRQVGDRLGEANALFGIGDSLHYLAQLQEALEHYQQALQLYRQVEFRQGEANALFRIGDVLQLLKHSQEVLEQYQQALNLYRQVGNRLGEANTLKAIGDVLQFLDRPQEALEYYQQALQLYRQMGSRLGEANSLFGVGDVLAFLDRPQEALEQYQQALQLFRQVGDRLGEANALRGIGDVLAFLDRRQEALEHYQQALGLCRQMGAQWGEAYILLGMGNLKSDRQQALADFQQAQTLYQQIDHQYDQARNLTEFIAPAQLELGQRDAAIESLTEAAQIYAEIGYEAGQKKALERLKALTEES